jgi:hypothetical protein
MVARINAIIRKGEKLAGADANFYNQELEDFGRLAEHPFPR